MRISFRGNDEGGVLLIAVVLIMAFSILFLSVVPYISALHSVGNKEMTRVLEKIQTQNSEVLEKYDLH